MTGMTCMVAAGAPYTSRARLTKARPSAHRLVEHDADRHLQQPAAELEIDEEIDPAAFRIRRERPPVLQVAERPLLVVHPNLARPVELHPAAKAFAERAEADREVGEQLRFGLRAHPRAHAPGQELRIFADIGDEIKNLVGRVGDALLLGVRGIASDPERGRLGGARRLQRGEIALGVIGAARQRRRRHHQETLSRARSRHSPRIPPASRSGRAPHASASAADIGRW